MNPSRRLVRRLLARVALACVTLPAFAQNPPAPRTGAPPKECDARIIGVTVNGVVTSHVETFGRPSGKRDVIYGGGFDARCAGTTQRLRSDSAEQYGDERRLVLIGHVHYTEDRVKLDADRMTYYTGEERLIAEGNVSGVTNTGTHFTGPRAEYLRVARGIRERSRLTAESRPNVWLSPKDAGTTTKDSTNLQADLVISDNDSLVYAKGRVVIERPDLGTKSDSAFFDNGKEFMRLVYGPEIVGHGQRKFTLNGDVIDVYSRQRKVQRVKSAGKARANSDDVLLTSDTIDLRITDEKLSRAYAWGPQRARAKSRDQDLTADSIDVVMPAQVLREMRAVRGARAESVPDTSKIISTEMNFLTGEVIIARFDTAATGDTASKPAVRQITARGTKPPATSHYLVAPGGVGKTDRPNINYSVGEEILVDFKDRQVETVTVHGKVSGYYAEAIPDSVRMRNAADSAARRAPATKKPPATKP